MEKHILQHAICHKSSPILSYLNWSGNCTHRDHSVEFSKSDNLEIGHIGDMHSSIRCGGSVCLEWLFCVSKYQQLCLLLFLLAGFRALVVTVLVEAGSFVEIREVVLRASRGDCFLVCRSLFCPYSWDLGSQFVGTLSLVLASTFVGTDMQRRLWTMWSMVSSDITLKYAACLVLMCWPLHGKTWLTACYAINYSKWSGNGTLRIKVRKYWRSNDLEIQHLVFWRLPSLLWCRLSVCGIINNRG